EPLAGANPPLPLPRITETVLLLKLATARSGKLSSLKSATATETGKFPTATGEPMAGVNPPLPLPNSTETVPSLKFATARSGAPLRSKSPTAIEYGEEKDEDPTAIGDPAAGANPPLPLPS